MNRTKQVLTVLLLISVLLMSSCLGIKADIVLNSNGTGTITLEYLISKSLDALGKLDGNERWNTIPVGKADFERTMDRLPGMKLLSFSSKEDDKNLLVSAKIEFSNVESLLAFLDASGQKASFSGDASSGKMIFILNEGKKINNPEFDKFMADICKPYSINMSMTFPHEGLLELKTAQGNSLSAIPGSVVNPKGKKVSFSFPVYELISNEEGISAELKW